MNGDDGFQAQDLSVILELQETINDTAMLCIDLLDPEKKPFTVYDRSTAARYGRFSRSLNMVAGSPIISG